MISEMVIKYFGSYYIDSVGSDKCIVTVGDSWTYGDGPVSGFEDNKEWMDGYKHWDKTSKVNYQSHLRNLVPGYDILNLGVRGASIPAAIENLISAREIIDRYSTVIVLFGATLLSRDMVNLGVRNHPLDFQLGYADQFIENWGLQGDDAKYVKLHTVCVSSASSDYYLYYHNMYTLKLICDSNKYTLVPYHIFKESTPVKINETTQSNIGHYSSRFSPSLIRNIGEFSSMFEYLMDAGAKDKNDPMFYILPCLHPSEAGYEIMARKLFELIENIL